MFTKLYVAASTNPLDGRSPNTSVFGGNFNALLNRLFDGAWGIALLVTILAWIVAAAYLAVKSRNNPGQAGSAKGWLLAASAALILVAGASYFVGAAVQVAS